MIFDHYSKKPESEITYELYKTGEKKGTQKEPSKHETIKIDQPFGINAEVIRSHPDKYVMYLPFYNMKELLDISPPVNSFYVISKSEPFDDEMMIDENKRINWLTRFGMPDDGEHIIRIHCSGHMVKSDLISMLNEISPKFLIPVHTEFPEMFTQSGIYKNIQIIIPQRDQIYNF